MAKHKLDREVQAIQTVIAVLDPLDDDQRRRVMDYVGKRYGFGSGTPDFLPPSASLAPREHASITTGAPSPSQAIDIRALKEAKSPRAAIEMAVLVAHYLSELAPRGERKDNITRRDIEKYFKEAGYRLPSAPQYTLPNAAAAGYFTSAGHGNWRLNPVGYNLAVHGLPTEGAAAKKGSTTGRTTRKAAPKKRSKPGTGTQRARAKKKPAKRARKK